MPQERDQPTPLTADEFNQIKERTARLFALYNLCAARKLHWNTAHLEVRQLMVHLDTHFPGNDLLVLLAEVERLKGLPGVSSARAVTKQPPKSWTLLERRDTAWEHRLLNKPVSKRTKSDVEYLKQHMGMLGGCCDSFANNSGCDCEDQALPD